MPNPNEPTPGSPVKADVLQASPHPPLSVEAVAKAVARHKREHPGGKANQPKAKKHRRPARLFRSPALTRRSIPAPCLLLFTASSWKGWDGRPPDPILRPEKFAQTLRQHHD
jgi:hypothetical protein